MYVCVCAHFEVPVRDVVLVAEADGLEQLPHDLARSFLRQRHHLREVIEQLPLRTAAADTNTTCGARTSFRYNLFFFRNQRQIASKNHLGIGDKYLHCHLMSLFEVLK